VNDGKQVLCEFLFSGFSSVLVDSHESGVVLGKDELDEFPCESTEPVSVGNHNFLDQASHRSFQKGTKSFAVPINSRRNVCNQDVIRECGSEKSDLALKIVHLFLGRDSSINVRLFFLRIWMAPNNIINVLSIVEAVLG
jgi:hypothetical protein